MGGEQKDWDYGQQGYPAKSIEEPMFHHRIATVL